MDKQYSLTLKENITYDAIIIHYIKFHGEAVGIKKCQELYNCHLTIAMKHTRFLIQRDNVTREKYPTKSITEILQNKSSIFTPQIYINQSIHEHKPSMAEEKVNIFQSFLGCLVILFILFLIVFILYISSIPPIDNYGRY